MEYDFTCQVEECSVIPDRTNAYCEMHRSRQRKYGSPTPIRPCWECGKDFKWVNKSHSLRGGQSSGARGPTCPTCDAILIKYAEYIPKHVHLVTNHGISLVDYLKLLVSQDFSCIIDGAKPNESGYRLCIDHDHTCCPGRWGCKNCVRGLICVGCNTLIGYLETKRDLITKCQEYLGNSRPFQQTYLKLVDLERDDKNGSIG
jgi:hypothetical protein